MDEVEIQDIELGLLLEAVYTAYGYDFRDYNRAHVKRRVQQCLTQTGLEHVSALQHAVLRDRAVFKTLLRLLSINVTEMFRDPAFFRALRERVFPLWRERDFVKIWNPGCASGEETYSLAILLQEDGLYERTRIYATDFNETVVQKAKRGIYPVQRLQEYTLNYQRAGGRHPFSDYYTARYDGAILNARLKSRIVFGCHNLVSDGSLGEMDLILCRNVLIYFNQDLQVRVMRLFVDSLAPTGVLCLGTRESLEFNPIAGHFEFLDAGQRIYRYTGRVAG